MRWEDERWIKVYTRDTVDWAALSFEAQGLFMLLLRKVDRAGLMPLGKHGKRGVAVVIGHSHAWQSIEPALEELLADGCVCITEDGRLLIPNFLAAQEAKTSGAEKVRRLREKDRDVALSEGVTSKSSADIIGNLNRKVVSPEAVPETHAVTGRNQAVTDGNQRVTTRRDESRRDETRREDPPFPPSGGQKEDPGYIPPRSAVPLPADLHPFETDSTPTESLQEGLDRVNRAVRGAPYPWDETRDGHDSRKVLSLAGAGGVPEVLRRYEIGLKARNFGTRINRLGDFLKPGRWNAHAQPEPAGQSPPRLPDVKRGGAPAELFDHSKPQGAF